MSSSLARLKALSSKLEEKNRAKNDQVDTLLEVKNSVDTEAVQTIPAQEKKVDLVHNNADNVRIENMKRVKELYHKLHIFEKSPEFENLFIYKAMNLSGIGLKEEDFGEIREGKYIQIIAITYEPDKNGKKKAKNISLGYFGKAETLAPERKNDIIEFVLRWRYEKAFQNVEHYKDLIEKIKFTDTLF